MRDNSYQALKWASDPVRNRYNWYRQCLKYVRMSWGLPAVYGTARAAWENSKHRHTWKRGSGTAMIPYGAVIYTKPKSAGPRDPWHIVLASGWSRKTGHAKRVVWSTDVKVKGEVHAVLLVDLLDKWNHEVVGWASDLNGFVLPLPPPLRKQ